MELLAAVVLLITLALVSSAWGVDSRLWQARDEQLRSHRTWW